MATKRPSTSHIAPFGLRLQPELKRRLEEAATAADRSLNAEISARLELSFQADPHLPISREADFALRYMTALQVYEARRIQVRDQQEALDRKGKHASEEERFAAWTAQSELENMRRALKVLKDRFDAASYQLSLFDTAGTGAT